MNAFVLPKGTRGRIITRVSEFLGKLPAAQAWKVEVTPHKTKRSDSQNAYLWGVVYKTILEAGELQGWSSQDIHDYMLGEHFGWETLEGFGRKRLRPLRRSAKLTTTEFMDYIAFIQQRMAEHGVYIEDPNEYRGVGG